MRTTRIWLDDIRPAPTGYIHVHSVNEAKDLILLCEFMERNVELDLDHDLGDYAWDGGDAIKLVLWMAETERYYAIKLHTANPIGAENMAAIIRRYWK